MKAILFSFLVFLCYCSYGQQKTPKQLRHFMQAGPSPANEIPYGANPKAGHCVTAGDAKIYYEVYGKGKPIVVLHGGLFGSTCDPSNPVQQVVNTVQMTPNSQLSIIPNSTHGVFLENFPAVWASIVPFLKSN